VTPGTSPLRDNSLKHNLHNSNFLNTARGRPHNRQRVLARTLNFSGILVLAMVDFLANGLLLLSKGDTQFFQECPSHVVGFG